MPTLVSLVGIFKTELNTYHTNNNPMVNTVYKNKYYFEK